MSVDPRRRALELFADEHGGVPDFLVRSPGRVNLIGDHTDYNDGWVLPMAIDRHVWLACRARSDDWVQVSSDGFGSVRFEVRPRQPTGVLWGEYVAGVAWSLGSTGVVLRGWDGVIASDVPVGAGLSSSAAIELAAARAFASVAGLPWDPVEGAVAAQRAENDWVGMACGIMDQLVVAAAQPGGALFIDCRSLMMSHVPVPDGVEVLVVDSGTRRSLVDSAYNERRHECEVAATHLGVPALRDATDDLVRSSDLTGALRRRARHVVSENRRVLAMQHALIEGDVAGAGRLMTASHASLRDDFEVSTPDLDLLVDVLHGTEGVLGARMTGAGFGGSVVALVAADYAPAASTATTQAAGRAGLCDVAVHRTRPVGGASIESV